MIRSINCFAAILAAAALLVVAPARRALAQPAPDVYSVQIYDVRDLVAGEPGAETAGFAPTLDALAEFLREVLLKDPGSRIDVKGAGVLVARAVPAEQERIANALSELRDRKVPNYTLSIAVARVPAEARRSTPGSVEVVPESLDEARQKLAAGNGGAEVLAAPRITCRALESAQLMIGQTVHFISGYKLVSDVEGYSDGLRVPELQEFHDGLVLEAMMMPLPGEKEPSVRVKIKLKMGSVTRPVPVEDTPDGPVHHPVLDEKQIETTVAVPLGKTIAITGLPEGETESSASAAASPRAKDLVLLLNVEAAKK